MCCTVTRHEASKQRLLRHVNETTTGDIAIKSNKKIRIPYKNSNTAAVNGFCMSYEFFNEITLENFLLHDYKVDGREFFSYVQFKK